MNSTLDISINKISNSRISQYDINDVPFGKCFSDHMFVAEYSDGEWNKASIMPYADVPLSYATSALHYGQAIFEGMKAYKNSHSFSAPKNFSSLLPVITFFRLLLCLAI